MKLSRIACFVAISFALLRNVSGQSFENLDFESANVSGYPVDSINDVPVSSALPGWSAYGINNSSGTNALTQVGYDFISIGSSGISVIDSNAPGFSPLQGDYSAFLFGSRVGSVSNTAMISQTGLVPSGTMSLRLDAYAFDNFEVTLGGQTINMIPLQTFSNYTLYGGDISSFAGDVETLSLIAPRQLSPTV
jgi:hypothetical protein